MNKKLCMLLALLMLASTATACGDSGASETTADAAVDTTAAETVETAPQTFDFGMIAAVSALVSLMGFTLTKKR